MAPSVEVVIKRHGRDLQKRRVTIDSTTTVGKLRDHFKDQYPAGLQFYDSAGNDPLADRIVQEGESWIVVASDRFPFLRGIAEEALRGIRA